jgi:hypothetical protein
MNLRPTPRNVLSLTSSVLPFISVVFTGSALLHACFGRKVTRIADGQKLTYHVQPQSYQEIKGTMFQPIIPKQKISLSNVLNNVRHVPYRAPIMTYIFAMSTIWATSTMCNSNRRNI